MSVGVICDEHIPLQVIGTAGSGYWEYMRVGEELDTGVSDEKIWNYARDHNYLILTNDHDFLDRDIPDTTGLLFLTNQRLQANLMIKIMDQIGDYLEDPESAYGETIWVVRDWID